VGDVSLGAVSGAGFSDKVFPADRPSHTNAYANAPIHPPRRYINLSLHYLEQVIVALQERSVGLSR
jgi:hypothetical protein